MEFADGSTTVTRLRRKEEYDPYSGSLTLGNWDDPEELPLEGVFIAASSTQTRVEASRAALLEEKSLYLDDPDTDVQAQDRIRSESGTVYEIEGIPDADRNPWTGWMPAREIILRRVVG